MIAWIHFSLTVYVCVYIPITGQQKGKIECREQKSTVDSYSQQLIQTTQWKMHCTTIFWRLNSKGTIDLDCDSVCVCWSRAIYGLLFWYVLAAKNLMSSMESIPNHTINF